MEEKCELQECPDYFPPEIVAPVLPSDDGGSNGGGNGGSYTLPVASATTLGGVRSNNVAYGIVVDGSGRMKLANADALDHDIANLTELVGDLHDGLQRLVSGEGAI